VVSSALVYLFVPTQKPFYCQICEPAYDASNHIHQNIVNIEDAKQSNKLEQLDRQYETEALEHHRRKTFILRKIQNKTTQRRIHQQVSRNIFQRVDGKNILENILKIVNIIGAERNQIYVRPSARPPLVKPIFPSGRKIRIKQFDHNKHENKHNIRRERKLQKCIELHIKLPFQKIVRVAPCASLVSPRCGRLTG
jgi:hypothetical protein